MRSIPLAMTWEMLLRGRWSVLLGLLGANVWPVFLLWALSHEGGFDPHDPSLIVIHVVLVQINLFAFGAAVFSAQGPLSRLYSYPIRTEALVAWHMLSAMAFVAVEMVVSTAVLNALFGQGWPLWGPALFAATVVAASLAVMWLTEKTAWMPWTLALVGGALGLWLKSRYGPMFSHPDRLWMDVTPLEVATLLAVAVVSYRVAIEGVSRGRCGESLGSLGIVDWLERVLDRRPDAGPPFRSPAEAQFWFEWEKKGWWMPGMVGFCLILGVGVWLIFIRAPEDLVVGFVVGGGLLSVAGLIGGLVMGNAGSNDANYEMGHFLGTRPMTSAEMSRTILKAAVLSTLIAWAIWAAAFLSLFLILFATQSMPEPFPPRGVEWWYLPATLLGCWTVLGLVTSASLAGRFSLLQQLYFGLIAFAIVMLAVSKYVLSPVAVTQLYYGTLAISGVAFVLATAWAFGKARSGSLIRIPTVCVAASLWSVLSTVVLLEWFRHPVEKFPVYLFVIGLMAAAVAPLATAPLALTWNRNR